MSMLETFDKWIIGFSNRDNAGNSKNTTDIGFTLNETNTGGDPTVVYIPFSKAQDYLKQRGYKNVEKLDKIRQDLTLEEAKAVKYLQVVGS